MFLHLVDQQNCCFRQKFCNGVSRCYDHTLSEVLNPLLCISPAPRPHPHLKAPEMKLVELNINWAADEGIVKLGEGRRCTKFSALLFTAGVLLGILRVSANLRWHPRRSRAGSEETRVNQH